MFKVLLTGSTGFMGEYMLRNLSTSTEVITLSRNSAIIIADLSKEIAELPSTDLVIHCAGKAHFIPKSEVEIQEFFKVNVDGTQNLLSGLKQGVVIPKSFVFISTVAVYGLDQGESINESSPLLAKDPYGLSKIQAEKLVLEWCKKNNVICTILRLPLLVGENPPGNLGAMIKGIQKGYYFNIAGGNAKKSMVLAEDVAKILLKASEIGGIYNLTDGSNPNFYELSTTIAKQYGKSKLFNLPFIIAKCLALVGDLVGAKFPLNSKKLKKITTHLTFDDTKAREVLGWKPNKVLDYYKKQK
jgi:nucleoside-diphosphate-sugar epimerase